MLHLSRHDRRLDTFVSEETNHPPHFTNPYALHSFSEFFNRWISLLTNRRDDHARTRLPSSFHTHERKLSVARNQSEFHLVTPRLDPSMKRSKSVTSGEPPISSRMRSTAWVVLSLADKSRWNA